MNNKLKWLYLSIVFSLVLVILGLSLHSNSLLQAASVVNNFGLGYEQGFQNGYNQGYNSHIEYRDVIQYVDREVVKEVVKEVTVEKPIELREFTSLEELKTWLAEDDTNESIRLVAGRDGVFRPSDRYDCDDYALQLQRRAANSGFLMSVTIIREPQSPHMINLACIGNDIYYIEPQTDKVWFHCHKD